MWPGVCAVVKLQMTVVIRLTRSTPYTTPPIPSCRLSFRKTTLAGGAAAIRSADGCQTCCHKELGMRVYVLSLNKKEEKRKHLVIRSLKKCVQQRVSTQQCPNIHQHSGCVHHHKSAPLVVNVTSYWRPKVTKFGDALRGVRVVCLLYHVLLLLRLGTNTFTL